MSGAVAKRADRTPLTQRDPVGLAKHFFDSGYFDDTKSLSQAIVKMVAGEELGLGPMTSMQGLHIIQGKPSISANIMAAKVKMSEPYDYRVREANASKCRIAWFENGEEVGESEYTIEQAQKAGLIKQGGNWAKVPEDMLFARAISRGVRRFCPDVLAGTTAYVPDELGVEVDDTGEPVRVDAPEPNETPVIPDEPEAVDAVVVDEDVNDPAPVKTISKAEAGRIYDAAVGVDSIEPEQFAQAVGFVLDTDPGDLSKKGRAVEVLSGLTEEQAGRVKGWIEKKQAAMEREAARTEGESNE